MQPLRTSLEGALQGQYGQRFGLTDAQNLSTYDYAHGNNWPDISLNSAGDAIVESVRVDTDSRIRVDHAATLGAREITNFYLNAAGAIVTSTFFIADRAMTIWGIDELHSTAETATGTATLKVSHETGTQAPGAGTVVMSNTFNLKATANTTQSATLLAVDGNGVANAGIVLAAGDRLSVVVGGTATITAEAGVTLRVSMSPGFKEQPVSYRSIAAGGQATQFIFVANRDMVLVGGNFVCSAPETATGTCTLDITKDVSTNAPGAGTTMLASTVNLKTATANTVAGLSLSATGSVLKLVAGDRVAVKYAGTAALTALTGVVLTLYFQSVGGTAYYGQVDAHFALLANSAQGTQGFFIADRDYEVVDASEVHSTAGTDGSAVTVTFTIDKGVVAPGGGTAILTGTLDAKGTANTVQVGVLNVSRRTRLMSKGDLLSIKVTGVTTALAGVTANVSLLPR